MVGLQDLHSNDVSSLDQYFELIICLYINNEPGSRKKAIKLFSQLDNEQLNEWTEYLKNGSFPFTLAEEIEGFLIDNVKA